MIVKFRAEEQRILDNVEVDVKIDDIIDEVVFHDGGKELLLEVVVMVKFQLEALRKALMQLWGGNKI